MQLPIACPGCGHKYKLTVDNPASLAAKIFTCPKCKSSTPFSRILAQAGVTLPPSSMASSQSVPPPSGGAMGGLKTNIAVGTASGPETHIAGGGSSASGPETHIAGGGGYAGGNKTQVADVQKRPLLIVESMKRSFRLSNGEYILGRESSDSQANIKLAPDPYMSRCHARLRVGRTANEELAANLTAMNSQNDIFINNKRLPVGATARLRPGDVILLGTTKVKYIIG